MSLSQQWEKHRSSAADIGARIVSDFRAFRFTWAGFFKWTGIVIAAFLFAVIVTLYFLDWNQMRGPVGRYLSRRTGHAIRIDGDLKVKLFSWQPRVDAAGITIGNAANGPAWVARPAGQVGALRIETRLIPLLFGHLILPLVWIDRPNILLVRAADGRTNWDGPGSGGAFKLPPIRSFVVKDGHVEIHDAVRKLTFTGNVSSREEQGKAAFSLTGDGALNTRKFLADVKGGPLLNVDASRPYRFTADVQAGDTHAVIAGAITEPFHLDRFTATVMLSGANLSDLYDLTGLPMPRTPAYRLQTGLVRDSQLYRLNDLRGEVGDSDITGDLSVDAGGKVPMLRGRLASHALGLDDLGSVVGGGKNPPVKGRYLLPETPLHAERLRQMNAEVDYSAAKVRSRDFPLTSFSTHISLQGAILRLDPLAFGFTAGKLSGNLKVDSRGAQPVTSVDAKITDIRAEHFIPGKDKPIEGTLEARAQITGTGNSVHKAASNAAGTFTVVVPQGKIRASLAQWLGVNVIGALGLTLSGDKSNTDVRCAVAHFTARDGLLTSQQFVFDTDPVRADGHGTIDMKDETVDLTLAGAPKSFQLLRLHAPVTVKGAWAHPALGIDAGPALTQGGIGAALALLNPLAAVLAFVDPGLAKDANCTGLLTTAKSQGAPVKASAVRNAAKPRK